MGRIEPLIRLSLFQGCFMIIYYACNVYFVINTSITLGTLLYFTSRKCRTALLTDPLSQRSRVLGGGHEDVDIRTFYEI